LGVNFGDRIAIFLFLSIELFVSMIVTFRRGAAGVMLFPLSGPEAIKVLRGQ
jgi:acyl-coenzyme A synthetase/AMP-(fatty) acid ligase